MQRRLSWIHPCRAEVGISLTDPDTGDVAPRVSRHWLHGVDQTLSCQLVQTQSQQLCPGLLDQKQETETDVRCG